MSEGMEHDGSTPSGTSLMVNVITVLAGLMLLLLLALPFLVQLQPTSDTIAYVVYAVFLISLSVTIGMGVAFRLFARSPPPSMSGIMVRDYGFLEPGSEGQRWTRPGEAFAPSAPLGADASTGDEDDAPAPSDASSTAPATPLRSKDAQAVVSYLLDNGGTCYQSELVDAMDWTASKASRTLSKLEYDGTIARVRDGMSKRIQLIQDVNI